MVEDDIFGDTVDSTRATRLNLKLKNAIIFKLLNNRKFNAKNKVNLLLREAVNLRKDEKLELKKKEMDMRNMTLAEKIASLELNKAILSRENFKELQKTGERFSQDQTAENSRKLQLLKRVVE